MPSPTPKSSSARRQAFSAFSEDLTYIVIAGFALMMQAFVFAVIAYGYVATAVCVLIGPIFIPWFIVPKMDWLFWGWFKAFIGFSFYQVLPAAFIFIFAKVLSSDVRGHRHDQPLEHLTLLPALLR